MLKECACNNLLRHLNRLQTSLACVAHRFCRGMWQLAPRRPAGPILLFRWLLHPVGADTHKMDFHFTGISEIYSKERARCTVHILSMISAFK
jgi:hypothetical protein